MAWSRRTLSISTAGTTVVIPALAGRTPKIVRYSLDASGNNNATLDVQDTSGASLTGGPISLSTGISAAAYADQEDAKANPLYSANPGLGIQFVTAGTTAAITGWIDYFYN